MLRRLALPLVALALVAGGCGGDDDGANQGGKTATTQATTATTSGENTAYKTQVQTILGSVGTAGTTLGSAARRSRSTADLARALETFQSSVERAADRLRDLDAPEAAAEGQNDLEQVLREIASGVQSSIEAARAGDRAQFQQRFRAYQRRLDGEYRQRLTAAGEKIDRALAGQ